MLGVQRTTVQCNGNAPQYSMNIDYRDRDTRSFFYGSARLSRPRRVEGHAMLPRSC